MLAFPLLSLAAAAVSSSCVTLAAASPFAPNVEARSSDQAVFASSSFSRPVLVTLGVMSRCPDAHLMETTIDKVLQDKRVRNKALVELTFIGTRNESEPLGVTCKHGEIECKGNIHQLCAQHHLSPEKSWAFVECQNFDKERIGTLSLAKECARVASPDGKKTAWDPTVSGSLASCAEGEEGIKLLAESIETTRKLNVTKSATLLIGKAMTLRCVHDGTWKECDGGHEIADFVDTIQKEWERIQK